MDDTTPQFESPPRDEHGGEAVCWLAQVCDDCGALTEAPDAVCWRSSDHGSA